jgi:hypothetical protein
VYARLYHGAWSRRRTIGIVVLFCRDVQVDRVWVVALVGCGVNNGPQMVLLVLIIDMLLVQLSSEVLCINDSIVFQ